MVLLLVLVGCSVTPAEVRADLEAYVKRVNDWAPTEAETGRTIDRILATQFVDEAEVRRQIGDDAPRVARHLERIRAYTPATAAVRALHEQYVQAWQSVADGYASILGGLDQADASRLASGRREIERWRAELIDVAREIRRLRDAG